MEARGEEDHDVSLLLPPQPDVLVGHLLEDQGRRLLPHTEGPAHCLQRVVPAQLLCVVLDAAGGWGDMQVNQGLGLLSSAGTHWVGGQDTWSQGTCIRSELVHQQCLTISTISLLGGEFENEN